MARTENFTFAWIDLALDSGEIESGLLDPNPFCQRYGSAQEAIKVIKAMPPNPTSNKFKYFILIRGRGLYKIKK